MVSYWIVISILAFMQVPGVVYQAHVSDKWIHFLAYLILVFLLWFSVRPDSKVVWHSWATWLVFAVIVAYGGAVELVQPYFGRTKDLDDFLANAAGVFVGLIMFAFLAFWQALPAVSAITIFGLTNLAKANLSKLIPITDAVFHFFAYGGFALAWVRFTTLYLLRTTNSRRLLLTLSVPVGLLLIVKVSSLLLGRHFAMTDLMFAFLGIAGASCLAGLQKRHS